MKENKEKKELSEKLEKIDYYINSFPEHAFYDTWINQRVKIEQTLRSLEEKKDDKKTKGK